MRRRGAARRLPSGFALFRILAAPIATERDRPGTDAVFTALRRKAPTIAYRPLGVGLGAFRRMVLPPAAAGADKLRADGHRPRPFQIKVAFNHFYFVQLNSRQQPLAP